MQISPKIQALADLHEINSKFFNPILEINMDNPKVLGRAVSVARLTQELQRFQTKNNNHTGRPTDKEDTWLTTQLSGAGLSNSTVEDYKTEIYRNLERLRTHD